MEQINIAHIERQIESISSKITNERIKNLFTTQPVISYDVYKKTAVFCALKRYEEQVESNPLVPHAFYATLEQELENNSFIGTVKKYEQQLDSIVSIMNIDKKYLLNLLKILRKPNNEDQIEQLSARQELKTILRKYTSKFKEQYIRSIIDEKINLLKKHMKVKNTKTIHLLKVKTFINNVMSNQEIKDTIKTIIYDELGIRVNDQVLIELLEVTLSKEYTDSYNNSLQLKKPSTYNLYKSLHSLNRLNSNYTTKLNEIYNDSDVKIKELVIQILKTKERIKNINEQQGFTAYRTKKELLEQLQLLKNHTSKIDFQIIEEIAGILYNTEIELDLDDNNNFYFKLRGTLTKENIKECKEYEAKQKKIKKAHNEIYKFYKNQNDAILQLVKNTKSPTSLNEDSYEIDTSIWLTEEKIMNIVSLIDPIKIDELSTKAYNLLYKFLIEDGLLWAYIADNIDTETFSKIINNFNTVVATYEENKISISNLHEIIKTVNIHNYTDDLLIGLVGQEIATKVINYNQFSGIQVTDEVIHSRLRKLIDLAVRSEYINKSSLPFRCDVKLDNYKLQRYLNNDPNIFTSGIDTKTCFFISVNENDFFFYSLLNKNGFVLKIVNEKNELVARASCFRKNNVFMINGIRCKNNKVHPESKEDKEELLHIVDLIELFAEKLITRTSNDECPIDFVVCNKAGILENAFFENRFEQINSELFNEPINVYDKDWEEFVHTYDGQEQLLQEVPHSPTKSFTTDFGNHFPALLIKSRDYRPLFSPRDIAYNDQPATYIRPRKETEEYITREITDEILARINRIKALECFKGTEEEQREKQKNYTLYKASDIQSVEIGEDWYVLVNSSNELDSVELNSTCYEPSVIITKRSE